MIDIITHIQDLDLFRAEASEKADNGIFGFTKDDDGNVIYQITRIPVYYGKNNDSICLVRILSEAEQRSFDSMSSINRLGFCENKQYTFDEGCEDIYDSVYDQSPITIADENGVDHTYTPPSQIGVFA